MRVESGSVTVDSGSRRKGGELAGYGRFVDIIADANTQTGEQGGVGSSEGGDGAAVTLAQGGGDGGQSFSGYRAGMLDPSFAFGDLGGDGLMVGLEQGNGSSGRVFLEVFEDACDLLGGHATVNQTELDELLDESAGFNGDGGHEKNFETLKI